MYEGMAKFSNYTFKVEDVEKLGSELSEKEKILGFFLFCFFSEKALFFPF
jgi:hypothetical protein